MTGKVVYRRRKRIRLSGYDYAQPGGYFVTLCTYRHENLFGEIILGEMYRNGYGTIAAKAWEWLPQQYPYIELDAWILMPNHLHGIIMIHSDRRGRSRPAPTVDGSENRKPLSQLIGAFKTVSGKQINLLRKTADAHVWQRSFYEHIIRNKESLDKIRSYIVNNPKQLDPDQIIPDPDRDQSIG